MVTDGDQSTAFSADAHSHPSTTHTSIKQASNTSHALGIHTMHVNDAHTLTTQQRGQRNCANGCNVRKPNTRGQCTRGQHATHARGYCRCADLVDVHDVQRRDGAQEGGQERGHADDRRAFREVNQLRLQGFGTEAAIGMPRLRPSIIHPINQIGIAGWRPSSWCHQ